MIDVLITVDTECSLGGALADDKKRPVNPERAVLGRIGSEYYGTPLIMDILEINRLRGTFFIEVLASHVVNRQQMADAYGQIVFRGHDVQLHLHPVYHYYKLLLQGSLRHDHLPLNMDMIGALAPSTQIELLQEGISLVREFTGRTPVAFRAGCFGASSTTLSALQGVGIRYDSSFSAAYVGKTCLIESQHAINTPWQVGDVWEVPITNFETGIGHFRGLKPLDVVAVSWPEMMRVLNAADQLQLSPVVFLLHSLSLVKRADVQCCRMRPDSLVIRRFKALCRYLANNKDRFRTTTFSGPLQLTAANAPEITPNLGTVLPLCRKLIQGLNRIC